ncbi:phage tail protein, partial [Allofournierella sp.]|uniref:phage tail protein n=1 Tax=Allofournierella sp. TaxID=1940256 RepID=UPI003AB8FAF7
AGGQTGGQTGGQAGGGKVPALDTTAGTQVEDTLTPQLQAIVDKIRQLLEPLRAIDFGPLAEAFGRLKAAAEPLTRTLFAGLEWAWYNLFVPLAAWTIENLLPAFLDLLAAACRVLTSMLQALQPLGLWLWNSFLQPLAQWTGEGIVGVLQGITNGLRELSGWIDGHQVATQNLAVVIGSLSAALAAAIVIYKAWTAVQNAAGAAATTWQVISTAAVPVTNALGVASDFLSSKIAFVSLGIGLLVAAIVLLIMNWDTVKEVALNVWLWIQEIWGAVAAWFQEFVLGPLGEFFSFLWQGIQTGALAVWESIQSAFATAADWFYNVLIVPLTAHFTALFTFFKNIFQGLTTFLSGVFTGDWKKAWEGIKKLAMAPIEAIKSFFEKIFGSDLGESIKGGLNALIDLVNRFIGWLNDKLHFSWDGLTIMGKELFPAGSIRLANIPSIPRLAQGAVLPANKPFLAMVGEQRRGTNVEAPLETIKQAVAEVLGQLGGVQELATDVPIEISLDGEVLYRAMERIRAGRGVQIGGAFANAY